MATIEKSCPECGGKLVARQNHTTNEEFLGCERFPRCEHTEPMPESVPMRLAGVETLPGLD